MIFTICGATCEIFIETSWFYQRPQILRVLGGFRFRYAGFFVFWGLVHGRLWPLVGGPVDWICGFRAYLDG